MQLTAPSRRGTGVRSKPLAATTAPGFVNPNGQAVVRDTGARSTLRSGQSVYELRCTHCNRQYGCDGMDIKSRRCPGCQGGAPGQPVTEQPRGLFDSEE